MKHLTNFNKFIIEQTVNPTAPSEVETKPTGVDLRGNKLSSPPVKMDGKTLAVGGHDKLEKTKKRLFGLIRSKPGKNLIYTTLLNPTVEQIQNKIKMGWTFVWEETTTKQNLIKIKNTLQPKTLNLDYKDDSFFELGRYQLSKEFFDQLLIDLAPELVSYNVASILIESSTDKTKVMPSLQEDLRKGKYTPNNSGLTKARADSAAGYLNQMGIDSGLIQKKYYVEQGGVKDDKNRFVRLNINLQPKNIELGKVETTTNRVCYFQRIIEDKISKRPQDIPDKPHIPGGECPHHWWNKLFG
jgi:flagellar motor protein MotB